MIFPEAGRAIDELAAKLGLVYAAEFPMMVRDDLPIEPAGGCARQPRQQGARRFFLGATPSGYRLYEGLGFRTVCSARVWVSGETHQA